MAAKKKTQVAAFIEEMGDHAPVAASDDALTLISTLAQQQYEAALTVAKIEDQLKAAKEVVRRISEVDLPEALKAAGVKSFVTSNNLEIKLKEEVQVGISEARKEEAMAWLVKNKFGGLIKAAINVSFDREELSKAIKLAGRIAKDGYAATMSQSVHAQTLKAFVKEQMADTERYGADNPFPLELFGAFPYNVASVKPKNAK